MRRSVLRRFASAAVSHFGEYRDLRCILETALMLGSVEQCIDLSGKLRSIAFYGYVRSTLRQPLRFFRVLCSSTFRVLRSSAAFFAGGHRERLGYVAVSKGLLF